MLGNPGWGGATGRLVVIAVAERPRVTLQESCGPRLSYESPDVGEDIR